MKACLVAAVLCVGIASPSGAAAEAAITHVVVMPFTVSKGVDKKSGELLNEVYLTELSAVVPESIEVIGSSDVEALLGHEQQRQLSGCDDTACLVEIGNALGASHLVVPNLGMFGGQFLIHSKFLSVIDAKVLHRKILYVDATEAALLKGIREIAADLARTMKWPAPTGKPARPRVSRTTGTASPGAAEVAAEEKGGDSEEGPPLFTWIGAGVGAAGLIAAAGFGAGTLYFDGVVGSTQATWEEKEGAGAAGVGMLGGTAVGIGLLAAGATLLTLSLVEPDLFPGS